MKKLTLLLLLSGISFGLQAQQFMTRTGTIEFLSATPVEDIQAVNKQVSSVIDFDKNQFAFLVPIKAFQFEKALMQEHFNENYMESGEFPNASFKGEFVDLENLELDSDGSYRVTLTGVMSIHGTDKMIEEQANIHVKNGKVSLDSDFILRPEDYGVKIPAGKKDNISDVLDVSVRMNYAKK